MSRTSFTGTTQYFFASVRGTYFASSTGMETAVRSTNSTPSCIFSASMSCFSVMMPLCTSTSPRRSLLSFCSSSARSSCSCEIMPEDSSRSPKRIYAIGIHLRINKWGRRRGPAAKKTD